jgi:hypothetical protein
VPAASYSETFVRSAAGGQWKIIRVPPGRRAVIRMVTVAQASAEDVYVQVMISGLLLLHRLIPAGQRTESFELRAVAYTGETIHVFTGANTCAVTVAGFAFVDTSGQPGPPDWPQAQQDEASPEEVVQAGEVIGPVTE